MVPYAHTTRRAPARVRAESPLGTLLALLLSTLVPIALAASALGWRPSLPGLPALPGSHTAAAPANETGWGLPAGWFFIKGDPNQAGGPAGYSVTDADGQALWTAFQSLGAESYLGFPLTRRFTNPDGTYQLFQRGLLRADPATKQVAPTPLFDALHDAGHDAALLERYGIPPQELPAEAYTPSAWRERVGFLLNDYPALRGYLDSAPDAMRLFGMPTSAVHDMGPYQIVRFQNGALQLWKQDMPWATAGAVTPVNAGSLAVELGYVAGDPLTPEAPPARR